MIHPTSAAGSAYSRPLSPFAALGSLFMRAIVGGVLLYAGFIKAVGPTAEFAAVVDAYKILPSLVIMPFAFGLPYLEMWVGIFVLTGFATRKASAAAAFLFVLFIGVLGSALIRGIDLSKCGCFGSESLTPSHALVLDAALAVLSLFLWNISTRELPFSLDSWLDEGDMRHFRRRI